MYHSVHFLEEVTDLDYCYIFDGYIPQIFVHTKKFTHKVLIVTSTIVIGL